MSLKEELQQYLGIMCEVRDAKQRAAELGRRIREAEATQVTDSVYGTREDGTNGHIRITGVPLPEIDKLTDLRKKREMRFKVLAFEQEQRAAHLEERIAEIPDPIIRVILRQRYIDGMTWDTVSRHNGHAGTDWARVRAARFFAATEGGEQEMRREEQ